jgi:hypothetical protein
VPIKPRQHNLDHGLDGVGAADGAGGGFGHAEVADLAGL